MNKAPTVSETDKRIKQVIADKGTELYLSFLELEAFPEAVLNIEQLETLVLTGNNIQKLPADVIRLQKLRVLDISGNGITELPNELCHLPELRQFEAAANQLSALPAGLGNLRNLQTIDIYGNQLSELPESIHFCHNLSHLRASENALSRLPEQFGKLTSLLTLDLSYNEIEKLPLSFFNLTQLKELYLSGNQLDLPFDILSRYSSQPELLMEKIRDYEKSQSEELAKNQIKERDERRRELAQHQLAELIVINMSHFKRSPTGVNFNQIWRANNNLSEISKLISAFDRRIQDVFCIIFCLTEMMTSKKMDEISRLLNSNIVDTKKDTSLFVSMLRTIAKDNQIDHQIQLKSLQFNEQVLMESSFVEPSEYDKYFILWLVLSELTRSGEITLEEENLPSLEATIAYVISSFMHEHELANQIANGLIRLILHESESL